MTTPFTMDAASFPCYSKVDCEIDIDYIALKRSSK